MNRPLILAALVSVLAACGSDNGNNNTPPAKPTLGATQIDRMGRAGVNTALTDPFDIVSGMTPNQVKDAYNALTDPSTWSPQFKKNISTNLAILDSLDTVCGNQLLAGPSAVAGRYDTLAGVLVDDRLYVRTDKTTCTLPRRRGQRGGPDQRRLRRTDAALQHHRRHLLGAGDR